MLSDGERRNSIGRGRELGGTRQEGEGAVKGGEARRWAATVLSLTGLLCLPGNMILHLWEFVKAWS